MMKIPGYKYFDSLMSSIYKNSAVKAMQRGYSKALNMMKDTDEALLKSVENSDLDSTQIERLKELLYKRFDTLKNLADKSKVKTRIDKLNKSMKRIDIEAYEKMKSAKEGGITKLKENLDDFSRHAWAESTLANSRNIQAKQLEAFENFGLSTQEALELDELIKIGTKSNLQMRSDVQNSSKAMEKIFKKEKGAMFEKLRDINYGCAPADALGILTTMGLLKLYSAQADSKEEKMKVTLTTGLPLMVTLGTTLGATIKMVSGAKALVLGLFTGFIANKTGKTINEIYQKKHNTQGAPSTIITLDDCAKTGNKKYEK